MILEEAQFDEIRLDMRRQDQKRWEKTSLKRKGEMGERESRYKKRSQLRNQMSKYKVIFDRVWEKEEEEEDRCEVSVPVKAQNVLSQGPAVVYSLINKPVHRQIHSLRLHFPPRHLFWPLVNYDREKSAQKPEPKQA